jgi:hypothetical protein
MEHTCKLQTAEEQVAKRITQPGSQQQPKKQSTNRTDYDELLDELLDSDKGSLKEEPVEEEDSRVSTPREEAPSKHESQEESSGDEHRDVADRLSKQQEIRLMKQVREKKGLSEKQIEEMTYLDSDVLLKDEQYLSNVCFEVDNPYHYLEWEDANSFGYNTNSQFKHLIYRFKLRETPTGPRGYFECKDEDAAEELLMMKPTHKMEEMQLFQCVPYQVYMRRFRVRCIYHGDDLSFSGLKNAIQSQLQIRLRFTAYGKQWFFPKNSKKVIVLNLEDKAQASEVQSKGWVDVNGEIIGLLNSANLVRAFDVDYSVVFTDFPWKSSRHDIAEWIREIKPQPIFWHVFRDEFELAIRVFVTFPLIQLFDVPPFRSYSIRKVPVYKSECLDFEDVFWRDREQTTYESKNISKNFTQPPIREATSSFFGSKKTADTKERLALPNRSVNQPTVQNQPSFSEAMDRIMDLEDRFHDLQLDVNSIGLMVQEIHQEILQPRSYNQRHFSNNRSFGGYSNRTRRF